MTLKVSYDPFLTFSALELSQRFKPSKKMIPEYLRCAIVMLDDPTITSIQAHIYAEQESDSGHEISSLLESSDSRTATDISSVRNGYYEVYFKFNSNIWLSDASYYHISLSASGYSYADSSHIGWVRDWPNSTYDFDPSTQNIIESPYRFHLFGQRFVGV